MVPWKPARSDGDSGISPADQEFDPLGFGFGITSNRQRSAAFQKRMRSLEKSSGGALVAVPQRQRSTVDGIRNRQLVAPGRPVNNC